MKILIYLLWLLGAIIFIRSAFLTQGKISRKLFAADSYLLGQKTGALLYLLMLILSLIFYSNLWLPISAGVNLILTGCFYLQPTPRISRMILQIFLLANLLLIFIYFYSAFWRS